MTAPWNSTFTKPRKPMKKISDKKRRKNALKDPIREAMFERDYRICRLNPASPFYPMGAATLRISGKLDRCFGELTPHHLRKDGQGGAYIEENLVALCSSHNTWVEDNPIEAHDLGLVIRTGE